MDDTARSTPFTGGDSAQGLDPLTWSFDDLVEAALAGLRDEAGAARLVSGRSVTVEASPLLGSSSDMVVGLSAIPKGVSTEEHSHRAEELAIIAHGAGTIGIEKRRISVTAGDIVLTPAHSRHFTMASSETPLVVFWVYAPPGSEERWLSSENGP